MWKNFPSVRYMFILGFKNITRHIFYLNGVVGEYWFFLKEKMGKAIHNAISLADHSSGWWIIIMSQNIATDWGILAVDKECPSPLVHRPVKETSQARFPLPLAYWEKGSHIQGANKLDKHFFFKKK
jgi:hypothetical protein